VTGGYKAHGMKGWNTQLIKYEIDYWLRLLFFAALGVSDKYGETHRIVAMASVFYYLD
jgi:hypothetical protein